MSPHFSQDWHSRHIPLWTEQLKEFKDKKDLQFLEIGVFEGRSAIWLLDNFDCHITLIDTFQGSEEHAGMGISSDGLYDKFLENIEPYISRTEIIRDTSLKALIGLHCYNMEYKVEAYNFDCIHIDGSHMSRDVFTDIGLAWDLLKKGGILIADDYNWVKFTHQNAPHKTPKPELDGFLASYKGEYKIEHCDYQLIIRKI